MKTELKAKFLQHILGKKKENEGFTLIELLVVIIIIGILSAIALPSFLNQAAKAKQSEAKTYVGSVNRAQQSFRIENTQFASNIDQLQIGIPTSTDYYSYTLAASVNTTTVVAGAKDPTSLKGFSGGVSILTSGQTDAISCQTNGVQSQTPVVVPALTNTATSCANGMSTMK
ncbi:type IV pilin-like G/H family protein [Sphaerospermopsis sp. LEGE 08334]|uniref:type IV pilin-like G/H family protein n=1 Tax=Sphaerospermopsis sp. LEGE 08334 TaxID=1828651 RepID=UPI00187F8CDF|nr:type IV pilin-like G/H family protein [Sphaerospermopsis sp. LEGE 08334]MBE9056392.1 type IV pilin-like G/H family protein [Sphaerospermopsis sp. LEGE 08334]